MKLSHAILVGMLSALVAVACARYANFAGTTELQLASQPAFDRVMKTRTLRCGYSHLAGYFFTLDPSQNLTKGLVRDITEQMGRILGLKIVWAEELTPDQAGHYLASGRDDAMCFPLWPSAKSASKFDYTVPLDYMPIYAYARADDTRFDGDLSKINNKSIMVPVIEGGTGKDIADEDFPLASQYRLNEDKDGLHLMLAITTKNADVAFTDPFTAGDFMRNNPGLLKAIPNVYPVRVFAESFAVAKGETKLRDMLDVALTQMQQSGFIRAAFDKYLPERKGQYFNIAKPWEQ